MNKTDITNLITAIDDGGLNTAAEVRAILSKLRDNGYGDIIHDTHAINTLTSQTADLNFYDVYICKQGGKVTVSGTLVNKQTVISSNTSFLEVINTDYLPDLTNLSTVKFFGNLSTDNSNVRLGFDSANKLRVYSSIPVGTTIFINITYLTQN